MARPSTGWRACWPPDAACGAIWRARDYYLRAAAKGLPGAQFALGVMHARGVGGARDAACAAAWYRRAALQGDASAQNNLGALYARGDGVGRDDVLAAHWIELAARQGHALAQYNFGAMYAAGRGVGRDPVRACIWGWLAARGGVTRQTWLRAYARHKAEHAACAAPLTHQ